ncbi:MAG: prolipoprotein diacylglyceryl transferase, partial [Angelakisella sp.]
LIACHIKKLPPLPMLDVGMPALLLGQAIGRWGNFFNIEAFGGNTELPWGMTSKTIENFLARPDVVDELAKLGQTANPFVPVHPTFFYEFVWNLLGFLLLAFVLTPRRRYDGQVALGYMAWYGLGRAFIEGLRTDSLVTGTPWGMIRVSQYLAIAGFVVSLILLVYFGKKARSENRPAWMGLFADSEACAELLRRGDEAIADTKKKKPEAAEAVTETEAEAEAEAVTEAEAVIAPTELTETADEHTPDDSEESDSN